MISWEVSATFGKGWQQQHTTPEGAWNTKAFNVYIDSEENHSISKEVSGTFCKEREKKNTNS